ncbi:MAG: hypothetical protein LBD18_06785 [Treponema sp.]|jgi:alginate O-acetyltransferase complex protein AlgI|nr:hypothetical protein [Treponema sp.]
MLFSSIPFIILFLPVILLVYYCCPFLAGRNIILLAASLLFYAWGEPKFVILMALSILVNYSAGLLIGAGTFSKAQRKTFLAAGVFLNLLALFFFKYLGFSEQILNTLIRLFHLPAFQVKVHQFMLPLGISFYTFQSLSYLIDVYRSPPLVQRNIVKLGLFISFFPQLIAGPIVRYHDIYEQITSRRHSLELFSRGIERFIIGLAKKALVANTLAEVVDGILKLPYRDVPPVYLLLVVVCGTLQIYYDFSGYSDMAIGLGRMFGFRIMENFNYPLMARSPSDFWKRWHISLSTWARDYLYFPLGGGRKGAGRQIVNTLVVFALVGLWHGASYNFIVFGLISGMLVIMERALKAATDPFFAGKGKGGLIAKLVLSYAACFSIEITQFMYFRLDLQSSFSFYTNLFNIGRKVSTPLDVLFLTDTRFYIFFMAAIAFAFPWWRKLHIRENAATASVKYVLLLCLFVLSFGALTTDAYNPFIYFRF